MEMGNLYDEDNVLGESTRGRKIRERRAEVQLVAHLHHAGGVRKRGKTFFGLKQREGQPAMYLGE